MYGPSHKTMSAAAKSSRYLRRHTGHVRGYMVTSWP
jgi:hypothetical protein